MANSERIHLIRELCMTLYRFQYQLYASKTSHTETNNEDVNGDYISPIASLYERCYQIFNNDLIAKRIHPIEEFTSRVEKTNHHFNIVDQILHILLNAYDCSRAEEKMLFDLYASVMKLFNFNGNGDRFRIMSKILLGYSDCDHLFSKSSLKVHSTLVVKRRHAMVILASKRGVSVNEEFKGLSGEIYTPFSYMATFGHWDTACAILDMGACLTFSHGQPDEVEVKNASMIYFSSDLAQYNDLLLRNPGMLCEQSSVLGKNALMTFLDYGEGGYVIFRHIVAFSVQSQDMLKKKYPNFLKDQVDARDVVLNNALMHACINHFGSEILPYGTSDIISTLFNFSKDCINARNVINYSPLVCLWWNGEYVFKKTTTATCQSLESSDDSESDACVIIRYRSSNNMYIFSYYAVTRCVTALLSREIPVMPEDLYLIRRLIVGGNSPISEKYVSNDVTSDKNWLQWCAEHSESHCDQINSYYYLINQLKYYKYDICEKL